MAVRADHLCTLAQLEVVLGTDASLAAIREQAIDAATGAILSWCGRQVIHNPALATVTTEFHDGGDKWDSIYTREYPISSVTTLHDDPDRSYGATTLLTEGTHFIVYSDEGRVQLIQGSGLSILTGRDTQFFNPGFRNIKLVYVAGYTDQDSLPDDLEQACILWAIEILNTQKGTGLREDSISLCRKLFYTAAKQVPDPHIQRLLAPYRSPLILKV